MFRITRAEEQAFRLIMRLAAVGRQQTLGELAEAENLPEPTVAKLLGILRRGGLVEAMRGRLGGYVLGAEPRHISAGQIVRCVGGEPVFDFPCTRVDGPQDCPRVGDCGLRPVWRHLEDRVTEVLDGTSIADLLRKEASSARLLQELWPLERNDDSV